MKKIVKTGILASLSALLLVACGPKSEIEGFTRSKTGLHYKFITENNKGEQVKVGDVLFCECVTYLDDKELGSVSGNPEPLFKVTDDNAFNGCLNEGLMMMHVGDEAIFAVKADSLSHQGMRMPQAYQSGQNQTIRFKIKLHSVKSEEQMRKEFEAEMESRKNSEKAALEQYIAENGIKQPSTAEGLYIIPIKKGNGPQVEEWKSITVTYTGRFLDGSVFETSDKNESADAHDPITYTVGEQAMIKGWDIAIKTMRQGDKARVIIPSDYAYGAGNGSIPPYSTLVFDIEVLSVK